jgi:hypothetical protein
MKYQVTILDVANNVTYIVNVNSKNDVDAKYDAIDKVANRKQMALDMKKYLVATVINEVID